MVEPAFDTAEQSRADLREWFPSGGELSREGKAGQQHQRGFAANSRSEVLSVISFEIGLPMFVWDGTGWPGRCQAEKFTPRGAPRRAFDMPRPREYGFGRS